MYSISSPHKNSLSTRPLFALQMAKNCLTAFSFTKSLCVTASSQGS
eukprot:CAMPEP_0180785004 /NCGR_PEP_ID=MMETSP1038_2-20121128/49932_1 /TAXON_ID=632150 /ORGANISM="Azadinium spinosum, Strain 3D9" /LENGTH=45 /DNA_ID= /DNA_START= /DNA_END= /DNA_ORIENTATION=